MPLFNQILIVGPGLLGASLGMAAKEKKICNTLRVWARKESTLLDCQKKDWCDETFKSIEDGIKGSDLVVVCTPVNHIEKILQKILPLASKNSLITDVGSVKESICRAAESCKEAVLGDFIGSHPMAGSEKSGMNHADPQLFEGRNCIITPCPQSSSLKIEKLEDFWSELGMSVTKQTPQEHDLTVAYVSHVPHLLASSLVESLSHQPEAWLKLSGKGLLDTTRIAQGDPELWSGIIKSNQACINQSLESWLHSIDKLRLILKEQEWEKLSAYLARAANCRKKI